MLEPVQLPPDHLVERFGVSARLAVRVCALAASGRGVTALVLEAAVAPDGAPLAALLLDPALLREPLDAPALAALMARHERDDFFQATPLALAPATETPLLCLDEERLAEQAFAPAPSGAAPAPSGAAPAHAEPSPSVGAPRSVAAASSPRGDSAPGPRPGVHTTQAPHATNDEPTAYPLATGGALTSGPLAALIGDGAALFSEAQIAALAVELVTETDAGARVRALKKLMLARVAPEQAGAIYLHALADESPRVRAQAAEALGTLGLSPVMTAAIGRLSALAETDRAQVLSSLPALAAGVGPGERAVLLTVLVGTLRATELAATRTAVLEVLPALLPALVQDGADLTALEAELARQVFTHGTAVGASVYGVYAAGLNAHAPGWLARLTTRHRETPVGPARTLYLALRVEFDPDAQALGDCIEEITRHAVAGDELDATTRRLQTGLARLGEAALPALLGVLEGRAPAHADRHTEGHAEGHTPLAEAETPDPAPAQPNQEAGDEAALVALGVLERLTTERPLSPEARHTLGMSLATTYARARPAVRLAILESSLLVTLPFDDAVLEALASAITDDIHEHQLERTTAQLGAVLRRMGVPILPVLERAARQALYRQTRLTAVRLMGLIATDQGEPEPASIEALVNPAYRPPNQKRQAPSPETNLEPLRRTAAVLQRLAEDDEFPDRGPVYVALGQCAYSGALSAEVAGTIARMLLARLYQSGSAYSVVAALGYAGAAPTLRAPEVSEVVTTLTALSDAHFPERLSRVRDTADGPVYELGHETTAYTDLIPALFAGLERIALAPTTPAPVRAHIVARLEALWDDLVEYRAIWGPRNTIVLAGVLGNLARDPSTPVATQNAIIEQLLRRANNVMVMHILGDLLASADDGSERRARLAARLLDALLARLSEEGRDIEREDQQRILVTMLKVAGRARLGDDAARAEAVREQVAHRALEAIRDGLIALARPLRTFKEAAAVSADLKHEITRRLDKLHV